MTLDDYLKDVLFSGELSRKLEKPPNFSMKDLQVKCGPRDMPLQPARSKNISFSLDQVKFPKKEALKIESNRAKALHSFANHELLAIEMMAAALYSFEVEDPDELAKVRLGILKTIEDEQKHFKLYQKRCEDFGVQFGDFPLNNFFWRQLLKAKDYEQYFAILALTFENANLDFSKYYMTVFNEFGDLKTGSILEVVYEDEISHVGFGVHWLKKKCGSQGLWEYYQGLLPDMLSAGRAKGIIYDEVSRRRAGFDECFIQSLKNYIDPFHIVNRNKV